MVSKNIILGTIKRMKDAGLDKDSIIISLKDIGLSEKEIRECLAEAGFEDESSAKDLEKEGLQGAVKELEKKKTQDLQKVVLTKEESAKPLEESALKQAEVRQKPSENTSEKVVLQEEASEESLVEDDAEKLYSSVDEEDISLEQGEFINEEEELEDEKQGLGEEEKEVRFSEKIDDVQSVEFFSNLNEKLDKLNDMLAKQDNVKILEKIKSLEELCFQMSKDIAEIKAASSASNNILNKILETNRSVLISLSSKKSSK